MPTRTIDTQTFEGETIQCAKFVSDEPFSWKAAQIVQSSTDYEFQMVAKSSVATTLTIQVGDTVKTQAITTDFTRFVIPFPSVTNDVDSLYITFPSGTYWLYNLQLERASTPSAWRPAPEDAEDYADKAAQQAVDDQTQLDVFNKLTNNGASQGIYLLDGQLYINGEYIAANTISGNKIHGGTISGTEIDIGDGTFTVDSNGQVSSSNMNITGGAFNIGNDVFKVEPSGKVTASNMNITGGTIKITTTSQSADIIEMTYSRWKSTLRPQFIKLEYENTVSGRTPFVNVSPLAIDGYQDTTIHGFQLSMPASTSSSSTAGLSLYDGAGMIRVLLTQTGLMFKDANGTTTKNYSAT